MTFLANSLVAIGEIELMSTTILPFDKPSATPPAPKRTVSTSGVSGTMVMIDLGLLANFLAVGAGDGALVDQLLRRSAAGVNEELMAAFEEVAGHRAPHDAEIR